MVCLAVLYSCEASVVDVNRCSSRKGMLASFDDDIAAFFSHKELCPLINVKDQCVWIGLFKPWLNWPHLGTPLYQEIGGSRNC